jgi:hypothetical protein
LSKPKDATVQTSPIPPLVTTPETVLNRSWGGNFQNLLFTADLRPDGAINLNTTDQTTNFSEMPNLRGNSDHKNVDSQDLASQLMRGERPLSNVGVSVVLTVNIDDKDYLLLARRETKEGPRLMLPSGYVDAYRGDGEAQKSPALLTEQALKELNEELIPTDGDNLLRPKIFESSISQMLAVELKIIEPGKEDSSILPALLRHAYPKLTELTDKSYTDDNPYEIHGGYFPKCVRSLSNGPAVYVDGQHTAFRFHLDLPIASGQVVAAYRIELPDVRNLSLFHAETKPDVAWDEEEGKKGHLKEVLDPRGLVVAELDEDGEMTGDLFRVYEGKLVRVGEEEFPQSITRFSEVFAWPVQGVSVPAVTGDVNWSIYFQ